jgi:hypothetical protein
MSYELTSPCDTCPFRRDVHPFIRPDRVLEIERGLERSEFPCHKTVDHENRDESTEIHCAGALILLEKMQRPSQMMRISERLGLYDASKLDMDAPVYDDFNEMLAAHRKAMKRKAVRR